MKLAISGVGVWGPGLYSWDDFLTGQQSGFDQLSESTQAPSPKSIPARERRRAPLPVKLAVETIEQACEMADVDPATTATIFSSAMGDNDITDYICRTLIGPERLLSPTKFHNSVHNAASGYWSIAAQNRSPSGYVGGFEDSFAISVLEAATLCKAEERPVVLAIYDVPTVGPLRDICRIENAFGAAIVFDPVRRANCWPVEINCRPGKSDRPEPHNRHLQNLCERNPAGQSLAVLENIALGQPASLCWPIGESTHLELNLSIH